MRGIHKTTRCVAGYGIVCGLIFPLMISSTYLQAMSLSHGAGDAFGLMFFFAYALALLGCGMAGVLNAGVRGGRAFFAVGTACAFVGNALMLARRAGVFDAGWPQTIAMALLIGFGLALAELYWLGRMSVCMTTSDTFPVGMVGASYLMGCAVACFIFAADGPIELSGALALLALSVPLASSAGRAVRGGEENISLGGVSGAERAPLLKATLYLVVLSFVFGAVSQASTIAGRSYAFIETQALLGIAVAGIAALGVSRWQSLRPTSPDAYWVLFPLVAVTLVALPFIESSAVIAVAVVLVFVAFYLVGINLRACAMRLVACDPARGLASMSGALGAGAVAVMAGVLLGARILSDENPGVGLAFVSAVSLFVLAMSTPAARLLEHWGGARGDVAIGRREKDGIACEVGAAGAADLGENNYVQDYGLSGGVGGKGRPSISPAEAFARSRGMTAREAQVAGLLCQGRTRTYIAESLGISPNTVKGYISNVYQKAGAADKQELIDMVEAWASGSCADETDGCGEVG